VLWRYCRGKEKDKSRDGLGRSTRVFDEYRSVAVYARVEVGEMGPEGDETRTLSVALTGAREVERLRQVGKRSFQFDDDDRKDTATLIYIQKASYFFKFGGVNARMKPPQKKRFCERNHNIPTVLRQRSLLTAHRSLS